MRRLDRRAKLDWGFLPILVRSSLEALAQARPALLMCFTSALTTQVLQTEKTATSKHESFSILLILVIAFAWKAAMVAAMCLKLISEARLTPSTWLMCAPAVSSTAPPSDSTYLMVSRMGGVLMIPVSRAPIACKFSFSGGHCACFFTDNNDAVYVLLSEPYAHPLRSPISHDWLSAENAVFAAESILGDLCFSTLAYHIRIDASRSVQGLMQ